MMVYNIMTVVNSSRENGLLLFSLDISSSVHAVPFCKAKCLCLNFSVGLSLP